RLGPAPEPEAAFGRPVLLLQQRAGQPAPGHAPGGPAPDLTPQLLHVRRPAFFVPPFRRSSWQSVGKSTPASSRGPPPAAWKQTRGFNGTTNAETPGKGSS
ncbi:hypothetical protein Vretifemale_12998, partial [Volvox reticuliferus]